MKRRWIYIYKLYINDQYYKAIQTAYIKLKKNALKLHFVKRDKARKKSFNEEGNRLIRKQFEKLVF